MRSRTEPALRAKHRLVHACGIERILFIAAQQDLAARQHHGPPAATQLSAISAGESRAMYDRLRPYLAGRRTVIITTGMHVTWQHVLLSLAPTLCCRALFVIPDKTRVQPGGGTIAPLSPYRRRQVAEETLRQICGCIESGCTAPDTLVLVGTPNWLEILAERVLNTGPPRKGPRQSPWNHPLRQGDAFLLYCEPSRHRTSRVTVGRVITNIPQERNPS